MELFLSLYQLIDMNRKMATLVLIAVLTGGALPGCGSPAAGVPESTKSGREKYKEMRAKAAAESTLDEK